MIVLGYINNKIHERAILLRLLSPVHFLSVATRNFKIAYVIHITFLVETVVLDQWFSSVISGPAAFASASHDNLLEMQILCCPGPTEPESLGMGPSSLHFTKSSRPFLSENSPASFCDTVPSQTHPLLTPSLLTPWSEHHSVLPGPLQLLTNWFPGI